MTTYLLFDCHGDGVELGETFTFNFLVELDKRVELKGRLSFALISRISLL